MKRECDFGQGKRGPVLRTPKERTRAKTRVTIRLDDDLLAWFRRRVEDAGGGNYQTLINDALRAAMEPEREPLEATLRRVMWDEIRKAG